MATKQSYIKVKSVCQGSYYIDRVDSNINLADLLDGAPVGEDDGYIVSIIEMTEDEFNNLPEFTGF